MSHNDVISRRYLAPLQSIWRAAIVSGVAVVLSACQLESSSQTPVADDWSLPGGDSGKTFYSRLNQINTANVAQLGLAWEFDLETGRGQESTPVLLGDVLVTSSNLGRVYAVDARTGQERWRFVPTVDMQVNRTACCDQVNRGIAVSEGLIYVGALDGQLYALNQYTGELVWQASTLDGDDRGQNITGAPEVAGNVVVIGNGGAEYGVRGYVTAFDKHSGELLWRFYTVPRDPALGPQESPALEDALATWGKDTRWELGLGGTVWDAIHYDPDFDAVYIGVGNGGPYHKNKRAPSGGDQLFLSSLVALDPATGRLKWYYQETPGDSWDYTATSPMILTDMTIDGETVPALIHAPKNGFLYVFDRRDGRLLKANAIAYQNWTDGIDMATGRPNIREDNVDYLTAPKIVFPATPGARNWHPASYNPETGYYYAAVQELGNLLFTTPGDKPYTRKGLNHDAMLVYSSDLLNMLPGFPPPVQAAVKNSPEYERIASGEQGSALKAIDPLTGETVWSVPSSSWQDRGGVLTTAGGLVFQGDATGRFSAYDITQGERLLSLQTGTSIMAAPMTYELDGVQYVAVNAGWGGGGWPYVARDSAAYHYSNRGRLLVFKLGGAAVPLPEPLPALQVAPEPPPQLAGVTEANIAHGQQIYMTQCTMCHSNQQRTISADLRRMERATHDIFDKIVLQGWYLPLGMPRWDDLLSADDVRDVHAYLIAEQAKVRAQELELQRQGQPLDAQPSGILSSY